MVWEHGKDLPKASKVKTILIHRLLLLKKTILRYMNLYL